MEIREIIAKELFLKHEFNWREYPTLKDKARLWKESHPNSIVKYPWYEIADTVIEMRKKKLF